MRQIDLIQQQSSDEFRQTLERIQDTGLAGTLSAGDRRAIDAARSMESLGRQSFRGGGATEAIILADQRHPYFIKDDKLVLEVPPGSDLTHDTDLLHLLEDQKERLEACALSAGRVDLMYHPRLPYAGTGWLISEDVVVTNAHVAREFAERFRGGYGFLDGSFGNAVRAELEPGHQHGANVMRAVKVTEVLYIAPLGQPDIAFLRVRNSEGIAPLALSPRRPRRGMPVAAVGYPAEDPQRNDPVLMDKLFGGVYRVKRISPGYVSDISGSEIEVLTDYTSLGGNSGSPVFDLDSANHEVMGLHFKGHFGEANHAVAADIVLATLRSVEGQTVFESAPIPETETTAAESLSDRTGYDPAFLGEGALAVPLPWLSSDLHEDLADVAGCDDKVLRYTHFSVMQSASRRLPRVTAVNIDGAQARKVKRRDSWRLDGRIDRAHQVGNALYHRNPLDKGHMVRRKDVGWGPLAEQAEHDSFHYTNAAPQHADLNQKEWAELEDYVLESAKTHGFRACVLTGPVFRDTDRPLRVQKDADDIPIPESFWKVVVMVTVDGGLSATGYVLTQGDMIRDLVESAFEYGAFRTYQVPIAKIEMETGLDFLTLRQHDPLGATVAQEGAFDEVARRISAPDDIRI